MNTNQINTKQKLIFEYVYSYTNPPPAEWQYENPVISNSPLLLDDEFEPERVRCVFEYPDGSQGVTRNLRSKSEALREKNTLIKIWKRINKKIKPC